MEFLRRSWAQIRAFLDNLDRNTQVTIWSVLIAGLLAAFIAVRWVGAPERVEVSSFTSSRQGDVVAVLQASGISAQVRNGQVTVPSDDHARAIFALQQQDLLKEDVSVAWAEYLSQQNPWDTDSTSQKKYLIALQRSLAEQIAMNPSVRSAAVTIAPEERRGFGTSHARRSATVSIVMEGARRVEQPLVAAAAGMVSGAVPGMTPQNVTVIDVNAGQAHEVRPRDEMAVTDFIKLVERHEERERRKIQEMLHYIRGVVVQVNVQVDDISQRQVQQTAYADSEPLQREVNEQTQTTQRMSAAEPGVQPNTGFDVDGGRTQVTSSTERSERDFGALPVTRVESARHTGHTVRRINVAVNVPRSFIVALWRQSNPDAEADPDDDVLEPIAQRQVASIESQLRPIIEAADAGVLSVSVFPDMASEMMQPAVQEASAVASVLGSDWVKPVSIAALALVPIFLMLRMVRKATAPQPLPSVEELAGVPPTLVIDDDLVGEADADEQTMPGVEVSEDDLRYRKIADQISEMIKNNPDEAGVLVTRWVDPDVL